MLRYKVSTWGFVADEPEELQVYYEGTDLELAQRVYDRLDRYTLRVKRIKPYATPEAFAAMFFFERYPHKDHPSRWSAIPARELDPEEYSTSKTGGIW